jgi:methyl-accepting chemotaxis protein
LVALITTVLGANGILALVINHFTAKAHRSLRASLKTNHGSLTTGDAIDHITEMNEQHAEQMAKITQTIEDHSQKHDRAIELLMSTVKAQEGLRDDLRDVRQDLSDARRATDGAHRALADRVRDLELQMLSEQEIAALVNKGENK